MDKVEQFVTDYIQREYTVPKDIDIMSLNFVETGYMDSLGLVQFYAELEDEFGIEFSEEDMENSDIRIVGKLIALVKEKIDEH